MPHEPDHRPAWITAPALCGAVAALAIPGLRSTPTAGATLLLVGALALLAGHRWGVWLVLPAHLTVLVNLVPTISLQLSTRTTAILVVMLTATPALLLSWIAVGGLLAREFARPRQRTRAFMVTFALGLLATSILLPVF